MAVARQRGVIEHRLALVYELSVSCRRRQECQGDDRDQALYICLPRKERMDLTLSDAAWISEHRANRPRVKRAG